ncbi:MAG TPA: preprotein translocase subunit SecE [Geobacterales bacterium]|nr:preprotein translocase subunit SecE [Geobacterales bacterium]
MLTKTMDFLKEVRAEMGRVTWPSRKETLATTALVVVIVLIIAVYLWGSDMLLTAAVQKVLR